MRINFCSDDTITIMMTMMMVIIGVKKDPRIQTSVTKYFPHNYVFTLLGSRKTVGGAFYSWF